MRAAGIDVLSQVARRAAVGLVERVVEAPRAAITGRDSNMRKRQRRVIDEFFCKVQTLGMRYGQRRCTDMPDKQPPEMAARYAEPFREVFD